MASRTYTFANSQTADGGQVETEFNEIYTNITNSNIASNAAIAISKTALGTFTDWTSWTPTYAGSGSMTWTSITTNHALYCQIGKVVFFSIRAQGTFGGTAAATITFTLPITPTQVVGGACLIDDGSRVSGNWLNSGGTALVNRYDATNFSLGTSRGLTVSGCYQVS